MSALSPILFVDDEELSHILFKAVFGDDYEVHTALSAHEALEILRRETIHLLITDQCMPEMTGAELLAEIKDELPDIGRVMLTAYSDLDAIVQAVNEGGIDRYVSKPWEVDDLKAVIDQTLEKHAERVRRKQLIEDLRDEAARERRRREELEKHVPPAVLDALRQARGD